MSGYAAFSWTPGHALAEARMALIREPLLARSGWRVADSAPGLLILIDPVRAMAVRRFGWRSGRVIGDLFERASHKGAGPVLARPSWIGSGRHRVSSVRRGYSRVQRMPPSPCTAAHCRNGGRLRKHSQDSSP